MIVSAVIVYGMSVLSQSEAAMKGAGDVANISRSLILSASPPVEGFDPYDATFAWK